MKGTETGLTIIAVYPALDNLFYDLLAEEASLCAKQKGIISRFSFSARLIHLLYFAMKPLLMLGALTRPLLIHDRSKCWAKSFVIWLSSLISCTLFFRRFLLSAVDLSSDSPVSEKSKKKSVEGEK